MIGSIGTASVIQREGQKTPDYRLKQVCADFESLFLTYLLKSSRSTVSGGSFFGDNHEGEIIKSMFDENLSKAVASSGGVGMGHLLYEQLMLNR